MYISLFIRIQTKNECINSGEPRLMEGHEQKEERKEGQQI
jgi:hypothetical protein